MNPLDYRSYEYEPVHGKYRFTYGESDECLTKDLADKIAG